MTDDDEAIELSLVLPAHNEEATIEAVVREVVAVAEELCPGDHEVIVIDDGSTDHTSAILDRLADELGAVTVVHQRPNRGHGPSLLAGFDRASGAWIAHLDTDDQIPVDQLALLWPRRTGPLVLGVRAQRHDPRHRLIITRVLWVIVARLAGQVIQDANVPCKLVSRPLWQAARPFIPDNTFAPSLALVLVAASRGDEIVQVPVAHRARPHGVSSLRPLRLARSLVVASAQTFRLGWRVTHP